MSRAQGHTRQNDHPRRYAAIYARVSTEDQGKGFSIPTQIEACHKLAAHEGYTIPEVYVLKDEGISGTTMDRPALRKLRDLVNACTVQAVIVYDPDRLSRNLGHQLLMAEEFERAGVTLLIVSHPMEQGPEGWLFFQMRGALAEYERAKLLERTRRGKEGRAKAGMPLGGRVPLGYRYCTAGPKTHQGWYEIDEDAARVVREIFRLCVEEGLPTRAIAQRLSAQRIPTERDRHGARWQRTQAAAPCAGTWSPSTVYAILTYEGYAGQGYWNKRRIVKINGHRQERPQPREEWIPFTIPVIIPREMFEAAQVQLARSKQRARRNRKAEYLLIGGRLRCGRCGRSLTGRYDGRDGTRSYRCTSYAVYLDPTLRCRGTLRADLVEPAVWRAVTDVLEDPARIAQGMTQYEAEATQRRASMAHERSLVQAQRERCDRKAQRWAEAYGAGVIDLQKFKSYKAEIEARRLGLLEQEARLTQEGEALEAEALTWDAVPEYCRRVREALTRFTMDEQRIALEALDIQVCWTPGRPFVITGRIPMDTVVPTTSR